jgi:hypothetical protein
MPIPHLVPREVLMSLELRVQQEICFTEDPRHPMRENRKIRKDPGKLTQSGERFKASRVKHYCIGDWALLCRGRGFNHTNTTGSHIGGNHDGTLSSLELVQDPITLILLLVAMNR